MGLTVSPTPAKLRICPQPAKFSAPAAMSAGLFFSADPRPAVIWVCRMRGMQAAVFRVIPINGKNKWAIFMGITAKLSEPIGSYFQSGSFAQVGGKPIAEVSTLG